MKHMIMIAVVLGAVSLAGCGDSGSTAPTTAPSASSERIKEDLRTAGENIKDAAQQAATEMRPALERAKENSRAALHNAAERVAERTATAPAVPPQ